MRAQPFASSTSAAVVLVMACGATGLLVLGRLASASEGVADDLSPLAWLLGWALLFWAVVAAALVSVATVRRLLNGQPPSTVSVLLLLAAAAVIGTALMTYPPMGTGSGGA